MSADVLRKLLPFANMVETEKNHNSKGDWNIQHHFIVSEGWDLEVVTVRLI